MSKKKKKKSCKSFFFFKQKVRNTLFLFLETVKNLNPRSSLNSAGHCSKTPKRSRFQRRNHQKRLRFMQSPPTVDEDKDDAVVLRSRAPHHSHQLSGPPLNLTLKLKPYLFQLFNHSSIPYILFTHFQYWQGILTTLSQSKGRYIYDYATVPFLAEVFKVYFNYSITCANYYCH